MENYSAIKKSTVLSFSEKWMELEIIMVSKKILGKTALFSLRKRI